MNISVVCIVPLAEETANFFFQHKNQFNSLQNPSTVSKSFSNRYDTLNHDGRLLNNLFEVYQLDEANSNNLAYIKKNTTNVVVHLTYEEEMTDFSLLDTLSERCNLFVNNYIASMLHLDAQQCHYQWVNRTLILDNQQIIHNQIELLKEKWLLTEENILKEIQERSYVLCWGNNLVLRNLPHITDLIKSLVMMQFHYIELDSLNIALQEQMYNLEILKSQSKSSTRKELIKKRNIILALQNRVEYSLIRFHDELIDLQSFKQFYHYQIMNIWKLDTLIQSCHQKIQYCQNEVSRIDGELSERAAIQADLLLFIIGLFGLLSYFLDISQLFDELKIDDVSKISYIFDHSSFGLFTVIALSLCLTSIVNYMRRK